MTERPAMSHKKRLTLEVVLSALSVLAILVPAGRWVLTPWFVAVATDALGGEMSKRAETQAAPANGGVKSILAANIEQLEGEVRSENFRKTKFPAKWNEVDEMKLGILEQRLSKARAALADFEHAAAKARAEMK